MKTTKVAYNKWFGDHFIVVSDCDKKSPIVLYSLLHKNDDRFHISNLFKEYVYEAIDGVPHGVVKRLYPDGSVAVATVFCNGVNKDIHPDSLSEQDWLYFRMSGRLPEKT